MSEQSTSVDEQTPGQWAIRWFAIVFVGCLCASVPVIHVLWHGVLGNEAAVVPTRSQASAPAATVDNLLSGDWMAKREVELREASPIVWSMRGNWNELRLRAGVPQSRAVHFGKDDWFFINTSIHPNNGAYQRATEKRRKFLRDVRDTVEAAGAKLMMMVIPDKARVYADMAFEDGVIPARKRDNYQRILDEIEGLGIATVDLATPMRAAAQAELATGSERKLFFARDTHWLPGGALIGEQIVAAAIEQRFGNLLSPRVEAQITGPLEVRAVGDLTGMLGLLTVLQPDDVTGKRTAAFSLLSDSLAEQRQYYGVQLVTDNGVVGMFGKDEDAEVLLIGTSFSMENGIYALSLHLGRAVRGTIIRGAQGMLPLRAALDELRQGTKAKVVVWEMVERGMFEGAWLDPKL